MIFCCETKGSTERLTSTLTAILTFGRVSAVDTKRVIIRTKECALPPEFFWTELNCLVSFFINFWDFLHTCILLLNLHQFLRFLFQLFLLLQVNILAQAIHPNQEYRPSSKELKRQLSLVKRKDKKELSLKSTLFWTHCCTESKIGYSAHRKFFFYRLAVKMNERPITK